MKPTPIQAPLARFTDGWVNQRFARQSQQITHQKAHCRDQNFADSQDGYRRLSRGETLERTWDVEKTDGFMPPGIHMRNFTHRETLTRSPSGTLHGTEHVEFHGRRSVVNRSYDAHAEGTDCTLVSFGRWDVRLNGLPGIYGRWPAKGRIEGRVRAAFQELDPTTIEVIRSIVQPDAPDASRE